MVSQGEGRVACLFMKVSCISTASILFSKGVRPGGRGVCVSTHDDGMHLNCKHALLEGGAAGAGRGSAGLYMAMHLNRKHALFEGGRIWTVAVLEIPSPVGVT